MQCARVYLILSNNMSMLSGPRRKQKVINLRAKNNAWSNDSSKFGQRMLEKMGWSEGKGLGAKENGIVEHVIARYRNDEKGLGFEDKNDQWIKHEDDFNALLANLSNGDNNDEKLHSGISLEVKSKKSKARVHYHKFTRGKDLTRYSEKDLANIFGKKTLKDEEKVEETINEEVKDTEQVFTEKGSMEDYFKSKLSNFKSKYKIYGGQESSKQDNDYVFKGFSGTLNESNDDKNCGFQPFSFCNKNDKSESKHIEIKKQKKNKKLQDQNLEVQENEDKSCGYQPFSFHNENNNIAEKIEEVEVKKQKKNKKSCKQNLNIQQNGDDENSRNQSEMQGEKEIECKKSKKSKKKKKEKETSLETEEVIDMPAEEHTNEYVPKKKKKRKNKDC